MRTIGEYIRAIVPRDCKSNVPAEYCVFFALIALFIGMRGFAESCNHRAFSMIAVTIPARPLRPVSGNVAQIDTRSGSDVEVASNPVSTIADSGLTRAATTTPDLVPTALRLMGNVVYLHPSTRKLFMEVGNLSSSGLAMKLDLGAISAIENEAGVSASSQINLVNNNDDHLIPAIEDASIIRTPACYVGDHKDTSEVLTGEGRRGYKQLVRNQRVKIEPEQNYSPGEVAAALNLSYDSALRRMQKMKGVVDYGTPTRRYKRGKRKLRISGKNLLAFVRTKTIV
jgi:hypothetical protein